MGDTRPEERVVQVEGMCYICLASNLELEFRIVTTFHCDGNQVDFLPTMLTLIVDGMKEIRFNGKRRNETQHSVDLLI